MYSTFLWIFFFNKKHRICVESADDGAAYLQLFGKGTSKGTTVHNITLVLLDRTTNEWSSCALAQGVNKQLNVVSPEI